MVLSSSTNPTVKSLIMILEDYLEEKGLPNFQGNYNLNLGGFRILNNSNKWNDWLYCLTDINGERTLFLAQGTTDPGKHYLLNPMNYLGTGILCEGYHKAIWKLGLHKGKVPAFVQNKPCRVYRDDNKNEVLDVNTPVNTGMYGVNGHPNYGRNYEGVNKASALCQVWKYQDDFTYFLNLAKEQVAHKWGSTFSYNLIDTAIDDRFTAKLLSLSTPT